MSPRARITLGFLILVALVLDFLFYTGFLASDDLQYLTGSRRIASLLSLEGLGRGAPGIGNCRLGVTVPSGIVYWITGGSVAAVAWFHVLYHLALVALAFVLGRLFKGEAAGLVAAGIAATSPIFYVFAGAILPDNATAVWLAVILILLELVRRREAAGGPLPARAALRWYAAIGALFGVAYACKDTALIMTVPAAACVMASAPSLKSPIWIRNGAFMIAGLLAFVVVEFLALRLVMGQWVFRPSMVERVGHVFLRRMEAQGSDPLSRFWYALDDRLSSLAPVSTWILLAGAVGYALTRERRFSLLAFFWWPFIYMTVGSTSFTAYRPSTIQTRYYAIIIIPAAVMTAIAAQALWARWRSWSRVPGLLRSRPALAAVLVVVLGVAWHELSTDLPKSGNMYKSRYVRALAAAYQVARDRHPQYPILIGSRFGDRMNHLLIREADERVYWGDSAPGPEPPYLVVGLGGDGAKAIDPLLQVELLQAVHPAASRFDAVKRDVDRLFGLPPSAPVAEDPVYGTVELVSRPGQEPAARQVASAWTVLRGAGRLRRLPDGHMLFWEGAEDNNLQLFGRRGAGSAPTDPLARLAPGTHRLRVALEVRLLGGKKAKVGLLGLAYDAAGQLAVREHELISLVAGAAPTSIAVELASGQPITAFRLRLKVAHRSSSGALFVAHPRIEEGP